MKLVFPNTTRPKKAAKHVAQLLRLPLATAQRSIACACGHKDWHELEGNLVAGSPSVLDQDLTRNDFLTRQASLSIALAAALEIPDGDAQYALAAARLTGDRASQLADQIAIRLACFRSTTLPEAAVRRPGAVGKLKSPGRNGEHVILCRFGKPTEAITHQSIATVADFEYVSPRAALPLFLPMRLYLPYGIWTEEDGAQVLFSRDYKPMWRVRKNGDVQRLEPWLWIRFKDQRYLWEVSESPWSNSRLKADLEHLMTDMGITELPILADALPLLVGASEKRNLTMEMAAELLRDSREATRPVIAA